MFDSFKPGEIIRFVSYPYKYAFHDVGGKEELCDSPVSCYKHHGCRYVAVIKYNGQTKLIDLDREEFGFISEFVEYNRSKLNYDKSGGIHVDFTVGVDELKP